jgi:hypothetical protein
MNQTAFEKRTPQQLGGGHRAVRTRNKSRLKPSFRWSPHRGGEGTLWPDRRSRVLAGRPFLAVAPAVALSSDNVQLWVSFLLDGLIVAVNAGRVEDCRGDVSQGGDRAASPGELPGPREIAKSGLHANIS